MTSAPNTIGITVPDSGGGYTVYVNTIPPSLTLARRYDSLGAARDHAAELAVITGWPVVDGNEGAAAFAYGEHQGSVTRILLSMADAVASPNAEWGASDFWAYAAHTQAQVLAASWRSMSSMDVAALTAIGGAMLRRAVEDLQLGSVSEVLALVMIVEGEA